MKFCKDCKWIVVPDIGIGYARCGHKNADRLHDTDYPVTGEIGPPVYCSTERIHGCGPDGKHWEASVTDA